jgi:hypothetical protein
MRLVPTVALAAALLLQGCQATHGLSETPLAANAATGHTVATTPDVAAWSRSFDGVRPPRAGCFTASFPDAAWSPVPCRTVAALRGHKVGSGNDYFAEVAPQIISSAEGWFPSVDGLRSVRSEHAGQGWSGSNSYSLQLNSQFFATSSCGRIAHCAGWVQFVYQNPVGTYGGDLYIWDWLVSTTSQKLSGCPPHAGWKYSYGACYQIAPKSVPVPNQSIANLSQMSIVGMAADDGDSIIYGVGTKKYAVRNAQNDDVADLAEHWQGAEFNVFAPGDGAMATFNPGTTIVVGLEINDRAQTAPTCLGNDGTTAESNNLSFVAAPASAPALANPSIRFRESDVANTGNPSCTALAGR